MERINGFDVPTKSGYRSFEVWCGDITSIEPGYDVLFVSAFPGDYTPTPASLIGALHHKLSVSVEDLSKSPMIEVSGALRYWIARAPEAAPFRFLVCVERGGAGHSATLRAAFQAVSLLEMETSREGEPEIEHVVLPLLGSGDQGLDPRSVIEPLQEGAQRLLETSPTVDRIQFVEYDRNKASQLGAALNDVLGRQVLVLANDGLASPLRAEIEGRLSRAEVAGLPAEIATPLRRHVLSPDSASHDIGVTGRRLVEFVVKEVLQSKKLGRSADLLKKIEGLGDQAISISPWIRSYMHTLRVFGNEGAHHKEQGRRFPKALGESDLALCLFCVHRILDFWIAYQDKPAPGA